MKLLNFFMRKKKKVVLVVQCRLSSTRLPRKAVLPLGGKCVLDWTLDAMKKVPADSYYLAVDMESEAELKPIAERHGWNFFAGSRTDVLDRFCRVIELSRADIVVRATADNPFLFYEAATDLVAEFRRREESSPVDYLTWTGLPHGSGVEVLNAHSLLRARTMTSLPYDHEHVGPALYNHADTFSCVFLKAPERYLAPEKRTTIDTASDYRRACAIVHGLSGRERVKVPYTTEQVLDALSRPYVSHPVLLVPSVRQGRGTGHLRRCLSLAISCTADIYIAPDSDLEACDALVDEAISRGLEPWQLVRSLDNAGQYALSLTDLFSAEPSFLKKLASLCPVAAMDEGAADTTNVDYLLDIIPSVGVDRAANRVEPGFIALPKKVRPAESRHAAVHTALVALGGEDPSALSFPAAHSLAKLGLYVTLLAQSETHAKSLSDSVPQDLQRFLKVVPPITDLKERLFEYDLVVTHYGFTAFEAEKAGCAVILLSTTELHYALAQKYGFACVPPDTDFDMAFSGLVKNSRSLYRPEQQVRTASLPEFVAALSQGALRDCPVCRRKAGERDAVVARTPFRTFRRCQSCGMIYMGFSLSSETVQYDRSYFYEEYQKQYGRTYLDDFAAIKAQGVRRMSVIDQLYRHSHSPVTPSVLDVGCAMGPFLDAANDAGWQVFGTDISHEAVDYVQRTLHYPAVRATFPTIDALAEFGMDRFDAVTMWYVIEHFQNLDEVLSAVCTLVKKGGIFAFSTPSASGVSAVFSKEQFFEQSPADHYSLWEPKLAASILKRYGFSVVKIVSTGIHPERFPSAKKHGWKQKSLPYAALSAASRLFKWGDTFEVYCRKVRDGGER